MLQAFTTLLSLHLLGEILVRALHLPVPGPVVGMLALVALLLRRGGPPAWLEPTAQGLLRHLGLLFVPAGVGIIVHTDLLTRAWLPLLLTLLLGTTLTLVVTALSLRLLLVLTARRAPATVEPSND
ncbi:MAG: CidA/LrgA family protein [Chloroflexaceae bacterium]